MEQNSILRISEKNIHTRDLLQQKILAFRNIIEPTLIFDVVTKTGQPKEYFAAIVLKKLYSITASIENCLFTNDIFLAVVLYRYLYELYIKTLYIFSGSSDDKIVSRLHDFYTSRNLRVADYLDGISEKHLPQQIRENHDEFYKTMSRMAHPNIESMALHVEKSADVQFEFMVPTINLSLWHAVEVVRIFHSFELLNCHNKINLSELVSVQNENLDKSK